MNNKKIITNSNALKWRENIVVKTKKCKNSSTTTRFTLTGLNTKNVIKPAK